MKSLREHLIDECGISADVADRLLAEYADDPRLRVDCERASEQLRRRLEARERGEPIPEPVSEKPPKRGRPRAWHERWACAASNFGVTSTRAAQNRRLAAYAMHTLLGSWDPAFAWFWKRRPCSKEECHGAEVVTFGKCLRQSVLTELGRLADDDLVVAYARHVAAAFADAPGWIVVGMLREARREARRAAPVEPQERVRVADRTQAPAVRVRVIEPDDDAQPEDEPRQLRRMRLEVSP